MDLYVHFNVSEESSNVVYGFSIFRVRDAFDFQRDLLRSIPQLNPRDHGFPCLLCDSLAQGLVFCDRSDDLVDSFAQGVDHVTCELLRTHLSFYDGAVQ